MRNRLIPIAAAALVAAAVFAPALAEEPEKPKLGWSNRGELAWTLTAGNADSNTISLANTLEYHWPDAMFRFYAFGIRSRADETRYFQVGVDDAGNPIAVGRTSSNLNAERYVLALNFQDAISARMFWFGAAGWERNEPSGLSSRLVAGGGIGNIWYENDRGHFRTSYGINYTWESFTNDDRDNYLGGNVTADWLWKFSPNASFQTVDTLFLNFFEMGDWRINSNNSLTVQMNKTLAISVGLTLLYDNEPATIDFPIYNSIGQETRFTESVEADKLDTIFTTALVVSF
jgi:putative salt-induced outer membrane protein YdiY